MREALERFEQLGDLRMQTQVHQQLGYAEKYRLEGYVRLEHYQRALELARGLGDRSLERHRHRTRAARPAAKIGPVFQVALDIAREQLDLRLETLAMGNLANMAHVDGDLARADEMFEQAVASSRAYGELWLLASRLSGLGRLRHERGAHDAAAAALREAVSAAEQAANVFIQARAMSAYAALLADVDEPREARRLLLQAEELLETRSPATLRDHQSLCEGFLLLADVRIPTTASDVDPARSIEEVLRRSGMRPR